MVNNRGRRKLAALREDYNRLLAALREAGLMAAPDSE